MPVKCHVCQKESIIIILLVSILRFSFFITNLSYFGSLYAFPQVLSDLVDKYLGHIAGKNTESDIAVVVPLTCGAKELLRVSDTT